MIPVGASDERGEFAWCLDDIIEIVRQMIFAVPLDERWYLEQYPAVASAISCGAARSAVHHFTAHGYFEGRRPFAEETARRKYPVQFSEIKRSLLVKPARRALNVDLTYDEYLALIRRLLVGVEVDEDWYRATYDDIPTVLSATGFPSVRHHFVQFGYFEHRMPFDIPVDEEFYLSVYPGIRGAIDRGVVCSARDHFIRFGYKEGRIPNPAVARECT
jgi:hypothetical protein